MAGKMSHTDFVIYQPVGSVTRGGDEYPVFTPEGQGTLLLRVDSLLCSVYVSVGLRSSRLIRSFALQSVRYVSSAIWLFSLHSVLARVRLSAEQK